MSTSVIIPYPNDRVYTDYDPRGIPQSLTSEVKTWLLDHDEGRAQFRQSRYRNGEYHGEEWVFQDHKLAMLFKLTFA